MPQEIKVIVTSPEHELMFQVQEIIESGMWIDALIQDIHAKGGHEALYIAVCHKEKVFQKKSFTPMYKKKNKPYLGPVATLPIVPEPPSPPENQPPPETTNDPSDATP